MLHGKLLNEDFKGPKTSSLYFTFRTVISRLKMLVTLFTVLLHVASFNAQDITNFVST
jgi:hypothetical protein